MGTCIELQSWHPIEASSGMASTDCLARFAISTTFAISQCCVKLRLSCKSLLQRNSMVFGQDLYHHWNWALHQGQRLFPHELAHASTVSQSCIELALSGFLLVSGTGCSKFKSTSHGVLTGSFCWSWVLSYCCSKTAVTLFSLVRVWILAQSLSMESHMLWIIPANMIG